MTEKAFDRRQRRVRIVKSDLTVYHPGSLYPKRMPDQHMILEWQASLLKFSQEEVQLNHVN